MGHERLGGASGRPSHVRNAPLATVDPKKAAVVKGELREGISPPRAPKTVREPLDLHGFRCSASDIHKPPLSKEVWIGTANPSQTLVWNVRTWPAMLREKVQVVATARPKVPMRRKGADCLAVAMKRV